MTKPFYITTLLLFLINFPSTAQTTDALRQKIKDIVSSKNAKVGVSIIGDNEKDNLSINGDMHFPMQSVFKFHIALAMLSEIDKGKFLFAQKIKIEPNDLLPNLYSPIREKYPKGTELSIAELLKYMVSESDNVACELLLKLLGGPQVVEDYFMKNHFKNVSIKVGEKLMQANWDLQFSNWTTPKAANNVLSSFYFNKSKWLSKTSYDFIWETMKKTETGKDRLKGQLPAGTVVAHKTGSSGTNKMGITAAVNDIGIVFLPNGQHFFISVFVTNSKENAATNEKIIANIGKAAWDYFTKNNK